MLQIAYSNFALFAPLGPLSPDQKLTAAAGISAFLLLLLIWMIRGRIIKTLRAELAQAQDSHAATSAAQQAESAAQIAELQQKLEASVAAQIVVEQRLASHCDASFRREAEARTRIASLESEIGPTRELAAQLPPTQARIGDLEGALTAERGRLAALEQALAATTLRAEDLETRLRNADAHKAELEQKLAADERTLAGDLLRLASADSEMIKLRDAHEAYRQQAEARISHLQRNHSGAEAVTQSR